MLPHATTTVEPATARPSESVVVGLDGGYVRSRHRQDERHFEVIAGKVIDAEGSEGPRVKTHGKKREHGQHSYDLGREYGYLVRVRHRLPVYCVQS